MRVRQEVAKGMVAAVLLVVVAGCGTSAGPSIVAPLDDSLSPLGLIAPTHIATTASVDFGTHLVGQGGAQQPLFEGWGQPQLVFMLSGRQNGYLEPCGCTGLANQKGGLARRMTLYQDLVNTRKWPVVPLDVGNYVKRYGRQSEIKFQRIVNGLSRMGYRAMGLGPDDLRLPSEELIAAMAASENPFVCANVVVIDEQFTPRTRIVKAGGKTIGITAILGGEEHKKVGDNDEVQFVPAKKALPAVIAELKRAKCDMMILLAHAGLVESRALAKDFPDFHLIVSAGGADEPPFEIEQVTGTKTQLVQVGAKGMYVGVLGMFGGDKPFRYQRVPLDNRFEDAPDMLRLLEAYQDQLRQEGFAALGLKPIVKDAGRKFVGSKACADCHSSAWEVFQNTTHAHATESLVNPPERGGIPRHFDPECVCCHVTGWEPQLVIPFKSGFAGLKETPELVGNGCENCHGPGSAHVAAEDGSRAVTDRERMSLREAMRLPLAKAEQKCLECHDIDNSPAFHQEGAFKEYWKKVEHKGKD